MYTTQHYRIKQGSYYNYNLRADIVLFTVLSL